MAKEKRDDGKEAAKKLPNGGRTKSSNPDVTASEVEAYAEDFHRRTTAMYLRMMRAAERMRDECGDGFQVKFITSLISNYLGEIEDRVERQFKDKLEDELAKEKARRELRDIIEKRHRRDSS